MGVERSAGRLKNVAERQYSIFAASFPGTRRDPFSGAGPSVRTLQENQVSD